MGLIARIKKLHLVNRNAVWWNSPLPVVEKFLYYGSMFSSIVRAYLVKKKRIKYLGDNLYYDNFATPLSLQAYPYEIYNSILANTPHFKVKRVLDIGGNIGQFSLTLSHALKDNVHIDVLEPNPEAFQLLRLNTAHRKNIRIFNLGIGKPSLKHMYYTPGRSATGSVFKRNADVESVAKKTKINLVDNIVKVTGRLNYDLVKIDVEGYEYNLLEVIKPLQTNTRDCLA